MAINNNPRLTLKFHSKINRRRFDYFEAMLLQHKCQDDMLLMEFNKHVLNLRIVAKLDYKAVYIMTSASDTARFSFLFFFFKYFINDLIVTKLFTVERKNIYVNVMFDGYKQKYTKEKNRTWEIRSFEKLVFSEYLKF